MVNEEYLEKNRTHLQIRSGGALGNLADGIEIPIHGIATRLIAWPGNGFQTESIHVLTHKPGDESGLYEYDMAEEALICFKGEGEVFLHDKWVSMKPGDIAFFPERVPHATRNSKNNKDDFIVVAQISPPEFAMYADSGYYDKEKCVMNFDAIEKDKTVAKTASLNSINEFQLHKHNPEVRANNLSIDDIRTKGALFNVYQGADFSGIDVPMVLILWPGYGVRSTGFHYGYLTPGTEAIHHTHPASDECVINWGGHGYGFLNDATVDMKPFDTLLAPSGVRHGGGVPKDASEPQFPGGCAAPPQLDLYAKTSYYKDGMFVVPEWKTLDTPK